MEGVEVLRFTVEEFQQWWLENKIQNQSNDYNIGYSRIVQELYIEHSKLMGVERRFVIEDFDGYRHSAYEKVLQNILEREDSVEVGQVVNARLIRDAGYNHSKIILCNRISDFEYRPSYRSILFYLRIKYHYVCFDEESINVKQTHMRKEEFDNLVAKLNMSGAQYMMVDYNTIGILVSANNLMIYTRQYGIKKNRLR
jgi:hypothetical protein